MTWTLCTLARHVQQVNINYILLQCIRSHGCIDLIDVSVHILFFTAQLGMTSFTFCTLRKFVTHFLGFGSRYVAVSCLKLYFVSETGVSQFCVCLWVYLCVFLKLKFRVLNKLIFCFYLYLFFVLLLGVCVYVNFHLNPFCGLC